MQTRQSAHAANGIEPNTSQRFAPARSLARLSLALVFALSAAPASAFDKQKAAAKMAERALAAYESGDYDRAADLYASAFHTDANPDYLYAQARAEQVGGKADLAVSHLEAVIANPESSADRKAKATDLLDGLRVARLDKRVSAGEAAAKSGDNRLAAQIWLDVVQSAPKRVDLYYLAGVALQQSGDAQGALGAFDSYLQKARQDAQDRSQAKLRRDSLAEKLRAGSKPKAVETEKPKEPLQTDVAPVAVPPPIVVPPPMVAKPAGSTTPTLGYVLAGTGAACAVGGVVLYVLTRPDVTAFQNATAAGANGQILGTDLQTATAQHMAIQTRETTAIALTGAGVVMAGVGAWLLLSAPNVKVAWTPGPALVGSGLAWRF